MEDINKDNIQHICTVILSRMLFIEIETLEHQLFHCQSY